MLRRLLGVVFFWLLLFTPSHARDNKRPTIQITTPTTQATYSTSASQLTIAGTANDPRGSVTRVTWQTDRGAAGTAQGTTSWSALIAFQSGTTRLTVTAYDAAGNQGQDVLTITVTAPSPPSAPITVFWQYDSTTGESFQLERCMITPTTCPMAPVTLVALSERQWTDTAVAPENRYCYRMAVVTQGRLGTYSNTLCSS